MYYLGKHFAIRGGSELHKLEHNKDVLLSQSEGEGEILIFTENRSSKQGMEDWIEAMSTRRIETMHPEDHALCLLFISLLSIN